MGNEKSRHVRATTCEPNGTCVICYEDVADNISRPDSCADHFFHHDCLMKWAEHKNTCPLDNKVFHHVVDLKGKKVSVPKRKPNEDEEGSEFLRRMLLILSLLNRRSDCSLCGNDSPELERASLTCGHRFHRTCILKLSRFSRQCPVENCGDDFTEIMCEFGEKIALISLTEDLICSLCDRVDSDIEFTMSDSCTHRNHRECMKQRCDRGDLTCPQCSSAVRYLRCDFGERLVVDQNEQRTFQCQICNQEDRYKEQTSSTTCGHVFHRDCVMRIFRTAEKCPVEGCSEPLTSLKCQFGDEFSHSGPRNQSNNPLHQMLLEATCDEDFMCEVCNERRPELERAKLPCDCEFHRECITELGRTERKPKCPKCQSPFDSARCMFGEQLTFRKEEEIMDEEEETTGAETAVVCSLCQAEVEEGYVCRSSTCAHPYHRVCLETIKEEGGSCLVCNKNISLVVGEDEAGATASPPPQPQPQAPVPATEAVTGASQQGGLCSSCHEVVEADQKVHPDQCEHLYHLSCLARDISQNVECYVCNRTMKGIVVVEDDHLTGENCIICTEAVRESQKYQTSCCRQWLHQRCFQMHLDIIRDCPACLNPMPI